MALIIAKPPTESPADRGPRSIDRRSAVRRRLTSDVASWVFLSPILVVFILFYVIPLVQSLYFSLTDANAYTTQMRWVGLANYGAAFRDSEMLASLWFTLGYAVATTVIVTCLAIPLAVILNTRFFGRNVARSLFFFPSVPSIAVLGMVWGFILNPLGSGVLNTIIHSLTGLGPVPWLADPHLAQVSVVAVAVWGQTGWHAILYLAYLQSIPSDYYDAATIDGAGTLRMFRSITLPLLAPAVTVSQLLLMTGGLKVYDLPFVLTKGGPSFATRTVTQSLIQHGVVEAEVGKASALAVLFLILVGIIVLGQLALSRRLEARFS
jgi:ABC-type sugar transport system permease subunit